jgi:hypothetical protein
MLGSFTISPGNLSYGCRNWGVKIQYSAPIEDKSAAHYSLAVTEWLNEKLSQHWYGRLEAVERPLRSLHLTPLDFYLWNHLKSKVYAVNVRNVEHLQQ